MEELTFQTSGSTGEPKRVTHDSALLRRESAFFLSLLATPARVVRLVPAPHIYGYIFTVLLPELAAVPVVDARGVDGDYIRTEFLPGDLVVAAPHQWAWLFQHGLNNVAPAGVQGVTSTGPACPDSFGTFPMLDVYGSTETSGVGFRWKFDEPYRHLPWWDASDPALEENDVLEWVAPSQFFVRARRDGSVAISGMNVYPGSIEARLRQHPDIAECAVRPMRAEEGRRLKASLILRPEADPHAIRRWIEQEFLGPERIASITFGDRLLH